jgi:RimJ/RimL family protein N-acetyltransferase
VILRPPARPLGDGAIVVRLPCGRDVEALVRYGDDPDVRETIWVPIPTPCSRAQAEERLDEFMRGWEAEDRFGPALIVADAQTDEMVGIVFLRPRDGNSVELSTNSRL